MCALALYEWQVLLLYSRGGSLTVMGTPEGAIPPHDGFGPLHVVFASRNDERDDWERRLAVEGVEVESRLCYQLEGACSSGIWMAIWSG